jgi:murein DD-endopeptidase MepM/ murein hydrolase activator NlpD
VKSVQNKNLNFPCLSFKRRAFRLTSFVLAFGLGLCLVCGHGFVLATGPNPSPNIKDLEKWRKTLNEYRSGVKQQRQKLQNLEDAARGRLGGLKQNVEMTTAQVEQAELTLQQAGQVLKQLETNLTIADQKYQQRLGVTVARLRFLQRQRPANTLSMLLASQDLGQFVSRRRQLQRIYQADQKLLVGLKIDSDRLQAQKQQVQVQSAQISELRQQLLRQKSDYEAQARVQEQLVNKLSGDRQAMTDAEDQLQRDSQNITLLIQQRISYLPRATRPEGTIIYGTGRLSYPSRAPMTSSFGWRMHPILGYRRFHSGTDFGAGIGSPIRAANAGRVIFAGRQGGYGNTVIIDHGGGITTLYGHASELYVKEGDQVEKGQAIGAVGSTGLSTGPHLHFEVRLNGEPQDPMNYL